MIRKKLATGIVALSMVIGSMATPMMASASTNEHMQNKLANYQAHAAKEPTNTIKPSSLIYLPEKFDLRNDGVVTPVKFQNPFGTCWSFGGAAAAESSILSYEGKTYAQTGLDISERHIAWFAYHPITKTDSKSQAGEGVYVPKIEGHNEIDYGGWAVLMSSLYASGMGPASEEVFPYHGKKELTQYTDMLENKEAFIQILRTNNEKAAAELGMTLEEYIAKKIEDEIAKNGSCPYSNVEEYFEYRYQYYLGVYKECDQYLDTDDWSIANTYKDKNGIVRSNRSRNMGYTLKNGNLLPEYGLKQYYVEEAKSDSNPYGIVWKGINADSYYSIKQELMNGHGVAVAFCADQSQPNEQGEAEYMNERTWAHYTYDFQYANHEVCIVGWDDNYSKENFNSAHRPKNDGAWLVKNSWGSETDYTTSKAGTKIGNMEWGVQNEKGEHTGYFWISYEDASLTEPESVEFDRAYTNDDYEILQYDFLPAHNYCYETRDTKISTSNIFPIEKNATVSSITVKTKEVNERVYCDVYLLNKNYKNPTDGKKIYSFCKNFEYGGYHRVDLVKDEQFSIKKGDKIAIVSTEVLINDDGTKTYWMSAAAGYDYDPQYPDDYYAKVIKNKGESLIYIDGKWQDYKDFAKTDEQAYGFCLDNFGLKLFTIPTEAKASAKTQTVTVKNKNVTLKAAVKADKLTANTAKADITAGCKTSGNGKLTYAKKSGNSGFVVTKDGKIYAKKGTKVGTYKVVVTVKASKTSKYYAATKDMVLTVKVAKK